MMHRASARSCSAIIVTVACALPTALHSQQATVAAHDTLRLGVLQRDALEHDPRAQQLRLLESQTALRLRDLDATRLPAIGANVQAQYQSQVVTFPFQLPGASLPGQPHDTYDAHVAAQQSLYDPSVSARRGVEHAQLAESQARVRSSLYALRQSVNDAYFAALTQQARVAEQQTVVTDLEAQRTIAVKRVREGAALQSDAEQLEAEILRQQQALAELAANRDAALIILGDLTGRRITSADALAIPDLGAEVASARSALDTLRARPEYQQFARSRDVLQQQQVSLDATQRPTISAFGRAGYGRPGLNPLARDFQDYWLAGVQVQWSPWNWGTTRREREALTIQQQIVASDEAAFQASVRRAVAQDVATIDRLAQTLVVDDTIVALRERILRETRFRFSEGVITSADYINRETDLLDARLARSGHRVELAQSRARFLTSLGLEVRQ